MIATGGATAMARRKPKPPRVRAAPPDLGTEQTRARLQPPPWAAWPTELQHAAAEMDTAVRIIRGRTGCRAQTFDPDSRGGDASQNPDESGMGAYERHCYRRHLGWLRLMRAVGWARDVPGVVACVVDHQPAGDEWQLRQALILFSTGRIGH